MSSMNKGKFAITKHIPERIPRGEPGWIGRTKWYVVKIEGYWNSGVYFVTCPLFPGRQYQVAESKIQIMESADVERFTLRLIEHGMNAYLLHDEMKKDVRTW